MRTTKVIHTVSCHAEGEVGDVIVGGVAPPPGETIWEQSRYIDRDQELARFLLREPRGGLFRHVNLLVPPKHPEADMGWIIMEPAHTPPMSGSNAMCVTTVLLETGIIAMQEPITHVTLEAPGGLVRVAAECKGGKVTRVTLTNLPAFVDRLNATLEVTGIGSLCVHTAYGGDSFVMVDAQALGFSLRADEAQELVDTGMRITRAANEQLGFCHPTNPEWRHLSFCQFAGPLEQQAPRQWHMRNAVCIEPGKIDRSPTGTGVSARLAVLSAQERLSKGDRLVMHSLVDSQFSGEIVEHTRVADKAAIIPKISGRAWITGTHQHTLDPDDPWPQGYRLSDTWPASPK